MTVCWHVDDLKVSHCDPAIVTIFGQWLSKKFGVAVATHRGKVHDYLGMIFDFSPKGKVMVTMMEYIKNIIKDFPEEIVGTKTSPAADHLFTVREPSLTKVLPEEQAMAFHRTAAQLLFLSARARRCWKKGERAPSLAPNVRPNLIGLNAACLLIDRCRLA